MIEVKELVKDYGRTRAVDHVSFAVNPGEVVGLLGPNGAGKSTTLRVLTGYLPPTAGGVKVGGVDVLEDPLEARRRVGYLSEVNPLYQSLGVWECLDFFGQLRGLSGAALKKRADDVSEACAIADVRHKDVGELSKGYRQRLGLALAMLHDPAVLILDEPTSALDPNQQKDVRELVLRLREKKTVLLSTHILPDAERLCDRLLIIHKGKIAAEGTIPELQAKLAGQTVFYVALRAPEAEAHAAIGGLAGVASVEPGEHREAGAPGFLVAGPESVREALTRLAAEKHWPLLELRRRGATLDDIFQSLTAAKP